MGYNKPDRTDSRLKGKIAVITGAAGNLGPIWIQALIKEGAIVYALVYKGSENHFSLEKFKNDVSVKIISCDVTDQNSLQAASFEICNKFGAPDILIANAGIDHSPSNSMDNAIESEPGFLFNQVLNVNVFGVFQTLQAFEAPMKKKRKGSVIIIGSLYATVAPDPSFYDHIKPKFTKPPAYGASKAAIVQLAKYFAIHWGPFNVRVNVLSPGGVLSNQDKVFIKKYTNRVPLQRMADATDLEGPLLFLASDESKYITGINLNVDGGFTSL